MKVRELMTKQPKFCGPGANLAEAAAVMWRNDCGALPVVDDGNQLKGIITDRDICIALGTRHQPPENITVNDVATHEVFTCSPDDDVHVPMGLMRRVKVRRLPVVDGEGKLEGVLALNDLVLAAERKHGEIDYEEVMSTIKAVSEHRGHKAQPETAPFPSAAVA